MVISKKTMKRIERELNILKETSSQDKDFIVKSAATFRYVVIFKFLRAIGLEIEYLKMIRKHRVSLKKIKPNAEYSNHDWTNEKSILNQFCETVGLGISYNQNSKKIHIIAA